MSTSQAGSALSRARELHRAGRLDAAAQAYRRAAQHAAQRVGGLLGLGIVELQRQQPARALPHLQQAARLAPHDPEVLVNLGQALLASGRAEAAIAPLRSATEAAPSIGAIWFQLGYVLQTAGQLFEAATAYERAVELDPDQADAHNNLAGLLQSLGRIEAAAAHFRAALALRPGDVAIKLNLAIALELAGDHEAARAAADEAAAAAPEAALPVLLQGRLAGRGGDLAQAAQLLQRVGESAPRPDIAASAAKELALVLDRQGRYDAAMAAAGRGNRIRRDDARAQGYDGQRWLARLRAYRSTFSRAFLARAVPPPADDPHSQPIFFVGFPRSGTTLMETIFAAHPDLITTGELTPLHAVLDRLAAGAPNGDVAGAISRLRDGEIADLRRMFWQAAEDLFGSAITTQRLVDKSPFNLAELGLINLLFPDARVVVALRDPRDVCLSCVMQDFTLSDAVDCMLDLPGTAQLYVETMSLWQHYRSVLTMPWMTYRYEDLVADPPAVAAEVFGFVGVPWDPTLLSARDAGQGRGYVGTPSRDAVGQAISSRAVGRWRRYADDLAPVLPVLAPMVRDLGYDDAPADAS